MKRLIFFSVMLFGLSAMVSAQKIEFTNLEESGDYSALNYGEIAQNADGVKVIKFKNTGSAPLILEKVSSTCGCTVPSYDKAPIMPGKSGEIKVKYNTSRVGPISKTLTIMSNDTESPRKLVKVIGKVNG